MQDYPFRLTPDPKYLYLSPGHGRAKAYMDFSVWRRDSFVVITGEVGSGKTTLIESVLAGVKQDIVVARIHQTQLNEEQLLQSILVEFGFKPFGAGKVELLHVLSDFLRRQHKRRRFVLLIIDEAQNLTPRVLEEIRLLTGLETHTDKMLNVLLVGQPELNETLNSPGLEQLVQRVRLRFHVDPLNPKESGQYIRHRLKVAGLPAGTELFPAEIMGLIHRFTGGVPRLINILCDTVLMGAYVEDIKTITGREVMMAIDELQWVPFQDRGLRSNAVHAVTLRTNMRMSPKLAICREGRLIGEYALNKRNVLIGRSPKCDIRLNDTKVSNSHVQIVTTSRNSFLIDMGSTNGTFIDNRVVKKYRLQDGDVFSIVDKYRIKYINGSGEKPGYLKAQGGHALGTNPSSEMEIKSS
ncbi:MAG TPA: AAA family ATPase [Gammaproteobacteria bacterium]